jgi:hypothetical protein
MPLRKILTEKEASKKKVGSFYHPTKTTFRSGACPRGMELREGYKKKSYMKKSGKRIKSSIIKPSCVKNKGLPGKTLKSAKVIMIKKNSKLHPYKYSTKLSSINRIKLLKKAIKDYSYKEIILELSARRTLTKRTNPKVSSIYDKDMKNLKKWKDSKDSKDKKVKDKKVKK